MSEFHSGSPAVAVTTEQLWAWADHPVNGRTMVECAMEVTWLRKCDARIVFMHGGSEVLGLEEYNDFYGFATCIPQAIEYAQKIAINFLVDRASTASVDVHLLVTHQPVLPGTGDEAQRMREKHAVDPKWKLVWKEFPRDKFRRRAVSEFSKPGTTQWIYPEILDSVIADKVIWTTKMSREEGDAQAIMLAMCKEFAPDAVKAAAS